MKRTVDIRTFNFLGAVAVLLFLPFASSAQNSDQAVWIASGSERLANADPTRESSAAGITVDVEFLDGHTEELRFRISIDTHMGSILGFDPAQIASLRSGTGVTAESGFVWEPESESSHHRIGILKIRNLKEEAPLFDDTTEFLELELRGIGVSSRTFRWTQDELR